MASKAALALTLALSAPCSALADDFLHYGAVSHHFNVPASNTLDYRQTHPCLGYETARWQAGWCKGSHGRNAWFAGLNWQGRMAKVWGIDIGWQFQLGVVSKFFAIGEDYDEKRKERLLPAPGITAQLGYWRGTFQYKPAFNKDEAEVVFMRLSLPLK